MWKILKTGNNDVRKIMTHLLFAVLIILTSSVASQSAEITLDPYHVSGKSRLPGISIEGKIEKGDFDKFLTAVKAGKDLAPDVYLGSPRAHLAGHSLGGAVVLAHARARPHSVASLSLVASAGLGRDINGGYIDGFVAAARRKDMKAVLPALFADPKLVSRQMVEDVLKAKRIDGATEALAALAAAQFPNGVQAVSLADPLAMPVQVIWGADDAIIPASHAGNLAGAKVTVLDAAGHMPHMEAAVAVNTLLTEFMAP